MPAPHTSIIPEKRIGNITAGTRKRGRTHGVWGGSQKGDRGKGGASRAASQSTTPGSEVSLTPEREMSENNSNGKGETDRPAERQQKKALTYNMNKHEKLVLICECCTYVQEYCALNKTKFWAMISNIFKQQTGYHLVNPQQTISN